MVEHPFGTAGIFLDGPGIRPPGRGLLSVAPGSPWASSPLVEGGFLHVGGGPLMFNDLPFPFSSLSDSSQDISPNAGVPRQPGPVDVFQKAGTPALCLGRPLDSQAGPFGSHKPREGADTNTPCTRKNEVITWI